MTTQQSAIEKLQASAVREFKALTSEQMDVRVYENSDVIALGSELACYKLAFMYKYIQNIRVGYSENYKKHYISIPLMYEGLI